jgi:threonine aldolase
MFSRRDFFKTTGLTAAGMGMMSFSAPLSSSEKKRLASLRAAVKFTRDGIDMHPLEYSVLLRQLAEEGKIPVDHYSRGGVVELLEEKFAALLGKESAVFMPTGTLANHIAVRKHAALHGGRRVIVQADSHLFNDSGDCAQTLSGLNLLPLAEGKTAFTLAEVQQAVAVTRQGRVKNRVGVISMESPVRRHHNAVFPFTEMKEIAAWARSEGIALHLDGARLFNAVAHSGIPATDYASLFDTVYVSMYKDFNAASGAILAGPTDFTKDLYHTRRMFGGGMPQVWPFAAVALHYTGTFLPEYRKAMERANHLITLLSADEHFRIERIPNGTNVFLLHISGINPIKYREALLKKNIELPPPAQDFTGFALKINTTLLRANPEDVAGRMTEGMED